MDNFKLNCVYDIGPFWNCEIEKMLNEIKEVSLIFNSSISIDKIFNNGCFLNVNYSCEGPNINFLFIKCVEGIISLTERSLVRICLKCGKDKGNPPSSSVYPAYCEICRENFSPSDFKGNVIICMSGKAGSGKDTVADYFVENKNFKRIAFADPLRDIVQLSLVKDKYNVWDRKLRESPLYNFPNYYNKEVKEAVDNGFKNFPNLSKEEWGKYIEHFNCPQLYDMDHWWSVRKLLQFIGTEMFRNMINRDIWINNFIQRLEPGKNYVLADMRFPNELDCVKEKFGGKVLFVEVVRNGFDGKSVGIENHESESHKLKSDIIIENNGTLQELYDKIEKNILVNL